MESNFTIFHTTYLFPGCSGGGVWNADWHLVGINMQENVIRLPHTEEIRLGEALSVASILRWLGSNIHVTEYM